MIELIDNLSQFVAVFIVGCLSSILYCRSRRQPYFLLSCFYFCFALGCLYWTLYYLLFVETPQIFYVSETGWMASYIFLCLLQYSLSDREERMFRCRTVWLAPLIGIPLLVFYCTYGDILSNICICGITIFILWSAIRGIAYRRHATDTTARNLRQFHILTAAFIITEYALWTASCFWISDTLSNPYFWFDFLMTALLCALLPVTRQAVDLCDQY